MENLEIWEKYCAPPAWAIKPIKAGRLKGMSDINPQWRLRALTEMFGPVGIGWYTQIDDVKVEKAEDGTAVASVIVSLFIKHEGEWSKPIVGLGGSMLVASESKGLRTSDEAFKMAETDAISVCCKKLGIAADIYLGQMGGTKYAVANAQTSGDSPKVQPLSADEAKTLVDTMVDLGNKSTTMKELGDLWNDNVHLINRLPAGQKKDLVGYKNERKAEIAALSKG